METLQVMRILVQEARKNSPAVQCWIMQEFSESTGSLDSIDHHVRGHFWYRPEENEVVRTPERMIVDWSNTGHFEGDCDDVAVMLAFIFCTLGYRSRFVAIRYDNNPNFEHVFVEAYDVEAGRWRVFDPTVDRGTIYQEQERMVVPVC